MSIYDAEISTLEGQKASLSDYEGKALLLVNVASKCGLTPQYEGLEKLHEQYAARGFEVLGFPCNQVGGQEPGTADEIREFCDTNYKVDVPLFEKIDVNGAHAHPIYQELTQTSTPLSSASLPRYLPQSQTMTATSTGFGRVFTPSCP